MERLDAARIDLPGVEVRIVERCASTNSQLLLYTSTAPLLLAAEEQTAGRGQRGRRWHSTAGRDVAFSLARCMQRPARELAALPLVAGVAVAGALRALGVSNTSLKWPNDLMVEGAKLGGILVETRGEGAATRAVFGIGINCAHVQGLERRLRRPIASLDQFIEPSRNAVIQASGRALVAALDRFEAHGFDGVRREGEAMDAHAGQRLRVRLADGRSITGIGAGVGADGALRLLNRDGEHAVRSGRIISSRLA
jgi:BirA family biotin operon repressor/biotin-[acetyl-CoA-carboxylase] ligase